jgi:transposase InsO family protein
VSWRATCRRDARRTWTRSRPCAAIEPAIEPRLWTADFKGHFRTRDGVYCYPLTIADLHTRYLLTCQGLLTTKGFGVRASFEQAFRTYGLPQAIRTDNGVPFATTGIHGLSRLNVWWMRLGIRHRVLLARLDERDYIIRGDTPLT